MEPEIVCGTFSPTATTKSKKIVRLLPRCKCANAKIISHSSFNLLFKNAAETSNWFYVGHFKVCCRARVLLIQQENLGLIVRYRFHDFRTIFPVGQKSPDFGTPPKAGILILRERKIKTREEETELKLFIARRVPCQNKYNFQYNLRRKRQLR
jgi:hypothetical protein